MTILGCKKDIMFCERDDCKNLIVVYVERFKITDLSFYVPSLFVFSVICPEITPILNVFEVEY